MAGVQQDYSTEMLAAEINGVRQGANGADGWGGGGGDGGPRGGARGYGQQPDGRQDRHGQVIQTTFISALEHSQGSCRCFVWVRVV